MNDSSSVKYLFDIIDEDATGKAKIEHIYIKSLFDRFDYDIQINDRNRVSILAAPNGCGKTTIFRLIKFLFCPSEDSFSVIKGIPFSEFSCHLSNGISVSLHRKIIDEKYKKSLLKAKTREVNYGIALSEIGQPYDYIFQIGDNRGNKKTLSLVHNLIDDMEGRTLVYYKELERTVTSRKRIYKQDSWIDDIFTSLQKYHCDLYVDFIEANRLQKEYTSIDRGIPNANLQTDYQRERLRTSKKIDFLEYANEEMISNINTWLQEYNRKLAEAKNRLPSMYIKSSNITGKVEYERFLRRWMQYHSELEKFHQIGLLDLTETVIDISDLKKAYDKKGPFLTTYLDAFEGTLEPLQKNYDKLKLFADIFNKRNEITRKTIKFTPDGIKVFSDGKEISIEYLSSGEKNDFVMFYRLIFNTPRYGIALIDEPEISLHIEWQEEYLDRLINICNMNDLQAIVATHSPNIVNDHLDLFVDIR